MFKSRQICNYFFKVALSFIWFLKLWRYIRCYVREGEYGERDKT